MSLITASIRSAFEHLSLHLLRQIEIRYRLINSFILLALLPLLISGYISYVDSVKAIEQRTRIFSTEMVKQVSKNVQQRMAQIDAETEGLVLSDQVQHALNDITDGNEMAQTAARREMTRMLLDHYGSVDFINQKYLLDKDNKIVDTQVSAQLTHGVIRFIVQAPNLHGRPYWGSYDNGGGQQSLGMLRTIISKSSSKLIGNLFLVIRPGHFSTIFDDVDLGSGTDFFILDADNSKVIVRPHNKPFSSTGEVAAPAMIEKIAHSMTISERSGFVSYTSKGQAQFLATYTQIPGTTWFVVSTIPMDKLTAEAQSVRNKIILIGLLCLLFSILLAYIISYSISAPLKELVDKMRETGNHATKMHAEEGVRNFVQIEGSDELGRLAQCFARMNDAINDKIDVIETQNKQLKKSDQLKEELNQSLEQKVEERTAELERAKEKAESANHQLAEQNARLESINHELESAQMHLRISEARLHTILDNSPIGIWLVGVDGRYHFLNKTFCNAVGIAESKFLSAQHLADIMDPEVAANCLKSDRECLEQDEPHLSHETLNFVDGKQHLVEITKVKLHDDTGRIIGIIGISVDITEQREREKALEAANRTRGEFLANMSHEIRTPMNSVLGMTQLVLRAETNPKQRDYLKKIQLSGEHLLGIIDSILDFSKIDAGKLKIEAVDFEIGEVIDNVANLVVAKAEEKKLCLIFDIDQSIPRYLRGDPLRLSQVLINLIDNAIKFTEQGEIIIRAGRVTESENDALLRFEIQDPGIGIHKAEIPLLFQTFQQADSSISRKYGGSGLGLAISKRLTMLMGGEIGVGSEAGKGSTFWFTARLIKGSKPEVLLPGDGQEQAGIAAIQGAHILLAEDNLLNQQVSSEFLKDAGAIVSVVGNGKEALDLLHHQHFDCVLMDMQMPVMDGLEATRLIRSDATTAGVLVIAMTANVSNEDRERCLAAGMNDFISKPFKPHALYATLAKWLSDRSSLSDVSVAPSAGIALAGDPGIIDLSVLAEMMGSHPERISEFARRFIASTKADIDEIEKALERNDMAALSVLGHSSMSPARMVGAIGFSRLCQELENCARSGDIEQVRDIVSQMSPLLSRIKERIDHDLA